MLVLPETRAHLRFSVRRDSDGEVPQGEWCITKDTLVAVSGADALALTDHDATQWTGNPFPAAELHLVAQGLRALRFLSGTGLDDPFVDKPLASRCVSLAQLSLSLPECVLQKTASFCLEAASALATSRNKAGARVARGIYMHGPAGAGKTRLLDDTLGACGIKSLWRGGHLALQGRMAHRHGAFWGEDLAALLAADPYSLWAIVVDGHSLCDSLDAHWDRVRAMCDESFAASPLTLVFVTGSASPTEVGLDTCCVYRLGEEIFVPGPSREQRKRLLETSAAAAVVDGGHEMALVRETTGLSVGRVIERMRAQNGTSGDRIGGSRRFRPPPPSADEYDAWVAILSRFRITAVDTSLGLWNGLASGELNTGFGPVLPLCTAQTFADRIAARSGADVVYKAVVEQARAVKGSSTDAVRRLHECLACARMNLEFLLVIEHSEIDGVLRDGIDLLFDIIEKNSNQSQIILLVPASKHQETLLFSS